MLSSKVYVLLAIFHFLPHLETERKNFLCQCCRRLCYDFTFFMLENNSLLKIYMGDDTAAAAASCHFNFWDLDTAT